MLDRLSRYLERDLEAKRKIQGALIYPAVVAAMSGVTVVVLAVFVLPKFKDFFSSLDAELPLPTRILLGVTDFLTAWWWALARRRGGRRRARRARLPDPPRAPACGTRCC